MKQELVLAFNEVLEEKQLPKDIILEALQEAMVQAYIKSVNATKGQAVTAEISLEKGEMHIYAEKEVVESVLDDRTEVTLEEALRNDPNAKLDDLVMVEITSTPKDFGRVAAQTARQKMAEKIREAEHKAQILYYEKQLGEIIGGTVQAISPAQLTIGLELKAEGTLMRKEIIPHERFDIHDRVRALVTEVKDTTKGPQILLSRTHRDFLRRLLENEVPEIFHGVVEIRAIAREPGQRAKVAVSCTQQGIDPVGACVGQRGVRIQNIVRELHNEKIDVIEYDPDPMGFIAKAIRPARVSGVYLNENPDGTRTAMVVVPEDQLSLAIGRDGQNARLAAKLTNWRIDIKGLAEAVADWLNTLAKEPALKKQYEVDAKQIKQIEDILSRKAEGRVISAEEYDQLGKFVDGLERHVMAKSQAARKAVQKQQQDLRQSIPAGAFQLVLADCDLPKKLIEILTAGGYTNAGDLALDVKSGSDKVNQLPGIGPKTLEKLQAFVESLPDIIVEPEVVVEEPPIDAQLPVEAAGELPTAETVEPEAQPVTADEQVTAVEEAPAEPQVELSFDEMFKAATLKVTKGDADEEEEVEVGAEGKKKKKKRKFREVTYDPDLDLTVVRKKHKSDDGTDWEE